MRRIIAAGAEPPLRKREPGFEGLARIIVSQQLSTASAAAIWARLAAAVSRHGAGRPRGRLRRGSARARPVRPRRSGRCGRSPPRSTTARCRSTSLAALPADEAHALLTAVKGIGPWTADIYLLFCLGHPDAFPAGDLALQEAARLAYGLEARPSAKEFIALAERWRPWRGVAAKVLWAYYRLAKAREGAPA